MTTEAARKRGPIAAFVVAALAFAGMSASLAQAPLGAEFHVNGYGKNPQGYQSVGVTKGGDFLVTWQEITIDGKHDGLWSQWFSPTGQPIGKNRLLQTSKSQAYSPLLAPGVHGGVLVLWRETHNTTAGYWEVMVGGELLSDGSWFLPPRYVTALWGLLPRFSSPLPQGGYAISVLGTRPTHLDEDRTFLLLTDDNLKVIRGPSPVSPFRGALRRSVVWR